MRMFDLERSLVATHRTEASDCLKIEEDLARYKVAISRSKPDVIIETGTYEGYSAKWFASLVPWVITIDSEPVVAKRIEKVNLPRRGAPPAESMGARNITWIIGDSVKMIGVIESLVSGGKRVMVSLDSNHDAGHVINEIAAFGPLVSRGCFLVVEDGILRWLPNSYVGNPLDAIEKMLVGNSEWRQAVEIEDLSPVSLFPSGWWVKR